MRDTTVGKGVGLAHRPTEHHRPGKTGHQPISNEDDTLWIVFNGQIYNYRELRVELIERGHRFKTKTDTEVILHAFEEFGVDCVQRLRGMFAFAIWNTRDRSLFLARDRFGQKPLFFRHDSDRLIFGSEIKAILAVEDVPRVLNKTSLHHYLSLRFVPTPDTMFEGIHSLPPAHTMTFRDGRVSQQRYWTLDYRDKFHKSERTVVAELTDLIDETVGCHLVSDVPVGAFLSGGLDSSLIVALMSGRTGAAVPTFCVGVEEQDYNEMPFAKLVADRYKTDHHEMIVRPDIVRLLPDIVWHMDLPGDPIATCIHFASKLAGRARQGRARRRGWRRTVRRVRPLRRQHDGGLVRDSAQLVPQTDARPTDPCRAGQLHVQEPRPEAPLDAPGFVFVRCADRYAASVAYFRFDDTAKARTLRRRPRGMPCAVSILPMR